VKFKPWELSNQPSEKQSCRTHRAVAVAVSKADYRYAWAERAKSCGYPERFAQEALGHNSKAAHRAYAKRALMKIPSLEDYERKAEGAVIPTVGIQ
jgi:hypothetical protein